ncbi:MAG: DNA-directed RNA polymerase subunit omega [candidate division Zixibacteria bacterium]|nr:DNA-directed RNA polymerase subunit omega [candidate division Zixibacteria bacterium]
MSKIDLEEIERQGLNRYEAVIVASRHARTLNSKRLRLLERMMDDPDIQIDSRKVSMTALLELLEGKVKFNRSDSM